MHDQQEKVIYLVRHGQSRDNIAPVFPSDDNGLSEQGIRQAETLAQRLSTIEFQGFISSPLERAMQTAEIIGRKDARTPQVNNLFVERIKPSATAGKSWDDPEAAALFHAWQQTLFTRGERVADGENFDDIIARADKAIDFLHTQAPPATVVVTHGFFLSTIVARILIGEHLTPEIHRNFQSRTMLENTSITVLRYVYDKHYDDHIWRLWAFNDHAHFAE